MGKQGVLAFFLLPVILLTGCMNDVAERDYKQDMRDFVAAISDYAKQQKSGFIIIPQNGQELLTLNGDNTGMHDASYCAVIDGVGREDLYFGYNSDNVATPASETAYMEDFLDIALAQGKTVLVTDYCSSQPNIDNSYLWNNQKGYISFAAPSRELDVVPGSPYNVHTNAVTTLGDAKNFLYLLNPDVNFADANTFVTTLDGTDYDCFIIDLFFDGVELASGQIASLKTKPGGSERLVIAYMSIGEAEDYRYYWDSSWNSDPPSFLAGENPDWAGNYKVRYWDPAWQAVIFGSPEAYLDKIIAAGFDGVYLDIIDAFEYFE